MISNASLLLVSLVIFLAGPVFGSGLLDLQDPRVVADLLEEPADDLIHLFLNEPEMFRALVEEEGLADMDHHRHLQSSYVDPSWWLEYKQLFKKRFKRCKALNNIAPADGTSCHRMRVGDYTCMFDDQTCADRSIKPKIKCDCMEADRKWQCEEYDACGDKTVVDACPAEHPVTYNPPLACTGALSCGYGEQSCCGNTFDKYTCDCVDGAFQCQNVNTCRPGVVCEAPIEVCPIEYPGNVACDATINSVRCTYGEICCPDGTCIEEYGAQCLGGIWIGDVTNLECAPVVETCPPEPPVGVGQGPCTIPEGVQCEWGESCCEVCGKMTNCVTSFGAFCTEEVGWLLFANAIDCVQIAQPCPPEIDETACEITGEIQEFGEWYCCDPADAQPEARCTCGADSVWACDILYNPFLATCICELPAPETNSTRV